MWISGTQEVIHNRVIAYMEKLVTFSHSWSLIRRKSLKTNRKQTKKQVPTPHVVRH